MIIMYNKRMAYIAITVDNLNEIDDYIQAGAEEFIFALANCHFSSLTSFSKEYLVTFKKKILKKKKMTVLMNRLFSQKQIAKAQDDLVYLLKEGIDNILFADPGLLRKAKQIDAIDKLIYSPETLLTSSYDAQIWLSLGLKKVVISPLLTAKEIMLIASLVPHLSLPIHGYQIMSVSQRHLLSAYQKYSGVQMQARDNQKLWIQETNRQGHMPIYESEFGTVIYTDFVLQSFQHLHKFVEMGIERLEINTHYLSKEESILAIQLYKAILSGKDGKKCEEEYRKAFSDLPLEDGYYGQKTIR